MELTERLPLKHIHWFSQMSYTDFVEKCLNDNRTHTKEECKTKYYILQHFCQTNLKNNGVTKRIYSYATNLQGGCLFSGGSLQSLPTAIRGVFIREVGTEDPCWV